MQKKVEKAVIVGLITQNQTKELAEEYLDELEFLAETAGAISLAKFTQKLQHPDPKTYVGSGKLNEIKEKVKVDDIDLVLFDDDLTPSQQRNIENVLECKVLDRSMLILDIFASRAQTAQAKTQVDLAQLQYLLPRLSKMWTHLQKQKGGIGMKGPGEKEIETDRRIIRDRILLLKNRLKDIDKQNFTQRKSRGRIIRVALVGYTNVGKSTLMNILSKSEVFAENKLFATLDSTVRKVTYDRLSFLLSDTVGFIRKLPHNLIESFKSTLDEVREADLLIHVVDISHSHFQDQIEIVNQTLLEIGAGLKPTILVFNKIDMLPEMLPETLPEDNLDKNAFSRDSLSNSWLSKGKDKLFVSAEKNINLSELKELILERVREIWIERYPFEKDYF